jgi:hypothetical protein
LEEDNRQDELKREQARIEHERKETKAKERLRQRDIMAYSDAIAQEICQRISAGELLTLITRDDYLPTAKRVVQMLN